MLRRVRRCIYTEFSKSQNPAPRAGDQAEFMPPGCRSITTNA